MAKQKGVFGVNSAERRTGDGRPSYRWTIELEVSETWVEDGFGAESSPGSIEFFESNLAERIMPYANGSEISVKIVKEPDIKAVRKAQGYDTKG